MSNLNNVMEGFRAFILESDIIDTAVSVVIGGAFNEIVTSLVNDILMPTLRALTNGASFSTPKYVINSAIQENDEKAEEETAMLYDSFLQNILDSIIIGVCMPFIVETVAVVNSRFHHEEEKKEEALAPTGSTQEELLAKIRNLLKEKNVSLWPNQLMFPINRI